MRRICGSSRVPIILFGDFNEILSATEKEGGALRRESQMDAFRATIDDCALHDLGYKGNVFTWQRGQEESNIIRERLDRDVATTCWSMLFPSAVVQHYPIYSSDHSAIIIREEEAQRSSYGRRGFKFEPFWLSDVQCKEVVKEAWGEVIGGDVPEKVGMSPSANMLERCRTIVEEVDGLRRQIETYWYTRARKSKQRKSRNLIKGIEDEGGQWCTRMTEMTKVIEDYFRQLFGSSNPENLEDVLESIPPVSDDEIREALFSMHPNKAPGPDGMHALFYQKHWEIVGPDICHFARECSPRKITEYRPISLSNRLKPLLNGFITENQSAFTPGRLITDNALIAFEIFHAMKRGGEGRHGHVAIKLDMSKAYDRVEWVFLDGVMRRMGFSERWRSKVMACASGIVRPSRGLRQEDLISPYLFLLKAVNGGRVHGARVCRGAPRIYHLFFADDTDIISSYEGASGQKINYSKSEVVFSKKVPSTVREEILNTLGVREERVWKKVQGWKEKMLSKPGKEILLKAVAQAIPTYMMSLFAERLCKPKACGGMGFRDLSVWRIMVNPESLVGRVMKARYFKHDDILDARRGHDPSLKWRIGERGGRVPKPNLEAEPSLRVASLIDVATEEDAKLVMKIPLSKRMPDDQIYWWPTKSGFYSVKSAYWLGMGSDRATDNQREACSESELWRVIWGASAGILGVKQNIFRRHCKSEIHALFTCQWTRSHWVESGLAYKVDDAPQTSFPEWLLWSLRQLDGDEKGRNYHIFDGDPINPRVVILGYVSMGGEKWEPPLSGTIKLNTDAALFGDAEVGLGIVGRDSMGSVMMVASRRIRANLSPAMAEAQAMLFGMETARRMGMMNICVESDALSVVQAVEKNVDNRGPLAWREHGSTLCCQIMYGSRG
ncbi:hypothetical protein RND81_08G022400 [Saponaria officinalis]|uniref:Reverse transcriptase domain-containing protein n=1 Tax=Saponaria officinalis TaxID=3572 RepID=A0AAW1J2R8_SAPOF